MSLDPPRGKSTDMYNSSNAMLRLGRVRAEMVAAKCDSLVLIAGPDSKYSLENARALSYLLLGTTASELRNPTLPEEYDETFLVISHEDIYIFTTPNAVDAITFRTASWPRCSVECVPAKIWDTDTEEAEKIKIVYFQKAVQASQNVGVAVGLSVPARDCEQYPLIQSYALDANTGMSRTSFFTMAKNVSNITSNLYDVYSHVDVQGALYLAHIPRLLFIHHWKNTIAEFDSRGPDPFEHLSTYYSYGAMGYDNSLNTAGISSPKFVRNAEEGYTSVEAWDPHCPMYAARCFFTSITNPLLETYNLMIQQFDSNVTSWLKKEKVSPAGLKLTIKPIDFGPYSPAGVVSPQGHHVIFFVRVESTVSPGIVYGDTVAWIEPDSKSAATNLTENILRTDVWIDAMHPRINPPSSNDDKLLTRGEWRFLDGVHVSSPSLEWSLRVQGEERSRAVSLFPNEKSLVVKDDRRGDMKFEFRSDGTLTGVEIFDGGVSLDAPVFVVLNDVAQGKFCFSLIPSGPARREFIQTVWPVWKKVLAEQNIATTSIANIKLHPAHIAHDRTFDHVLTVPYGMQAFYRELTEEFVLNILQVAEDAQEEEKEKKETSSSSTTKKFVHIVSGVAGSTKHKVATAFSQSLRAPLVMQDLKDGLNLNDAVMRHLIGKAFQDGASTVVLVNPGYTNTSRTVALVEGLGCTVASSTTVILTDVFFEPLQGKGCTLPAKGVLEHCARGYVSSFLVLSTPYTQALVEPTREVLQRVAPTAQIAFDTAEALEYTKQAPFDSPALKDDRRLTNAVAGGRKVLVEYGSPHQHPFGINSVLINIPALRLSKTKLQNTMSHVTDIFPQLIRWKGWLHVEGYQVEVVSVAGRPLLNKYKTIREDDVLVQSQIFLFIGEDLDRTSLEHYVTTQLESTASIVKAVKERNPPKMPRVLFESLCPTDIQEWLQSVEVNEMPLPEGWRHDGVCYVNDTTKSRSQERPDRVELIAILLRKLNEGA